MSFVWLCLAFRSRLTMQFVCYTVLLEAIRSVVPSNGQWKVLVLDEFSTKIISSCCRMFDIMEDGVTLVENLMINRQPLYSCAHDDVSSY